MGYISQSYKLCLLKLVYLFQICITVSFIHIQYFEFPYQKQDMAAAPSLA